MQALTYGTQTAAAYAASHRGSAMRDAADEQHFQASRTASHSGTPQFLLKTGVKTSVSLFILAIVINNVLGSVLLAVGLVVIISLLLLIGLTGLIRLESLVGRSNDLATENALGV